ncbi:hypothetical protein OAG24_01070 [bacterium]|nr:hypothetical protein [bacterium]
MRGQISITKFKAKFILYQQLIFQMCDSTIVYPQFNECQNYTFDKYWKELFSNCACNKFPRGIKYDNGKNIMYVKDTSKLKSNSFALPSSTEELFGLMMMIFKDILSLRSTQDIEKQNEELKKIKREREECLDCEWDKIKPKAVKDQLIMFYVLDLKNRYNLAPKEVKKLLSTIELGFQFKKLENEDVEYSNKKINHIKGLEYDEISRDFTTPRNIKKTIKIDKPAIPHKFEQALDQFIREQNSLLTALE